MRVAVIAGQTLDAQTRLFIDAVRRGGELAGIVQVRTKPRKSTRGARYRKRLRTDGLLRTLDFLGGVAVAARVKPRWHRRIDAALAEHAPDDVTEGVPVVDGGSANSEDEVRAIQSLEPDLTYQAGPGIVREPVFTAAPRGMLHVHHGILPGIKGVASPEWAVIEREPAWLGVTLHLIDAGIDTGALVAQGRPAVEAGDGWVDVRVKLSLLGARLIAEGLRALDGGLEAVPQPAELRSEYRTSPVLSEWRAFRRNLPAFLRSQAGGDEETRIGEYLSQGGGA